MEMICILCPMGCRLTVNETEDGIKVTGNSCPRGIKYGISEVTDPRRMVTSSVWVDNGDMPLVSVKTSSPIPKDSIEDALDSLKDIVLTAPVKIGDIVIENVANTGSDIIATRNVL